MSDSDRHPLRNEILDQVTLLDPPGGDSLRLRFSGPFEGRRVLWNARLCALGALPPNRPLHAARGNFIEVGEQTPDGLALTVGLAVEAIDLPTVTKAVIMIRRYRRLRRGRHEW